MLLVRLYPFVHPHTIKQKGDCVHGFAHFSFIFSKFKANKENSSIVIN
jgi:hypothetical protein